MNPTSCDALIIGGGPVGLTMACELLRHGISCRIIDKNEAPQPWSKAAAVAARTMEVFQDMGIVDRVLERGRPMYGANLMRGTERIARLSIAVPTTPYPYIFGMSQRETELLLAERLVQLGGEFRAQRGARRVRAGRARGDGNPSPRGRNGRGGAHALAHRLRRGAQHGASRARASVRSDSLVARLAGGAWPGNVRELEHTIERLVALSTGSVIDDDKGGLDAPDAREISLKERLAAVERGLIIDEMKRCKGNHSEAARRLGMSRPTLYEKLKRYGLK